MKIIKSVCLVLLLTLSINIFAGFSSGGRGYSGGFRSSSFTSSRSFSSARSYSAPRYVAPSRTIVNNHTTVVHSSGGGSGGFGHGFMGGMIGGMVGSSMGNHQPVVVAAPVAPMVAPMAAAPQQVVSDQGVTQVVQAPSNDHFWLYILLFMFLIFVILPLAIHLARRSE
jgi:hypothetical protein